MLANVRVILLELNFLLSRLLIFSSPIDMIGLC